MTACFCQVAFPCHSCVSAEHDVEGAISAQICHIWALTLMALRIIPLKSIDGPRGRSLFTSIDLPEIWAISMTPRYLWRATLFVGDGVFTGIILLQLEEWELLMPVIDLKISIKSIGSRGMVWLMRDQWYEWYKDERSSWQHISRPWLQRGLLSAKLRMPLLRGKERQESPSVLSAEGSKTFLWNLCCQWLLGRENHRKAPNSLIQNGANTLRLLDEWKSWEKASTPHYWGARTTGRHTEPGKWKRIKQPSAKC